MKVGYQPELDGLRALAVTIILIYHAGAKWLPGGYIGVDVFFVLSGFLITRILVVQLGADGKIDFRRFYLRRLRRLFPALMCTVLMSCVGAFLLMPPEQMVGYFSSAAAAVFSLSNIYFWMQDDYFDALSITKPLLHTWSLSVEEQFYLVWPVTILLFWRSFGRSGAIFGLLSLAILSLVYGEYQLSSDATAAFYLLPSRIIELAIGGLIVWMPAVRNRLVQEALVMLGLSAIIYAALFFDEKTLLPGLSSLLPCIGAAFFIAGSRAPTASAVFRTKPAVWLGKISYSLYLVHWPVVVFFVSYTFREPESMQDILLICAMSVILGWAQYQFVECRFRYPQETNRKFVIGASVSAIMVAAAMTPLSYGDGLRWRLPENRILMTNEEDRRTEIETYCPNQFPNISKTIIYCENFREKDDDIFIWGDSHARHLLAGISAAYPDFNIGLLYMSDCQAQNGFGDYERKLSRGRTDACIQRNLDALDFFVQSEPTNIVISGAKRSNPEAMAKATAEVINLLRDAGHNVILLGDFIRPGVSLSNCISVPEYIIDDDTIFRRCQPNESEVENELLYNREFAELVPDMISPNNIQCPNGRCMFFVDGTPIHRDTHHLSVFGSIAMVEMSKSQIPIKKKAEMTTASE